MEPHKGGRRLSDRGAVFCLGLAVQDTILSIPQSLGKAGKVYVTARHDVGGGPAANAAVTIARLGGRAELAGRLGDDATAVVILSELAREGVGTHWMRRCSGHDSAASVVLVDPDGERLIAVHAPRLPTGADWLAPDLSQVSAVLCDGSWPEGAETLLRAARARGVPSVLDADVTRHDRTAVAGLVTLATHVVFSRSGLAQFAGTDDIAAGLAQAAAVAPGAAMLGVTDGAEGLHLWQGTGQPPARSRPPAIVARDTTGAGDAFHGALALGLAHGWNALDAVALAHGVAALKCTRPGGRSGLPDAAALIAFDPTLAPMLAPRARSLIP
jgi:sulfofructose kinase